MNRTTYPNVLADPICLSRNERVRRAQATLLVDNVLSGSRPQAPWSPLIFNIALEAACGIHCERDCEFDPAYLATYFREYGISDETIRALSPLVEIHREPNSQEKVTDAVATAMADLLDRMDEMPSPLRIAGSA